IDVGARDATTSAPGNDPRPAPPGPASPPPASGVESVRETSRNDPAPGQGGVVADPALTPTAALGSTPASVGPGGGAVADAIPPAATTYPIDLTTALRLAEVENPVIAEARARVGEALALQGGARALLLPTWNAGTTSHGPDGNWQRSPGRILRLSEQPLYFGGGARPLAAESGASPAVRIFSPLTDAVYEPLAARQRTAGARFLASAVANDVLLEVADLFLDLQGAGSALEARRRSADEVAEVARLTSAYAEVGQQRKSDA